MVSKGGRGETGELGVGGVKAEDATGREGFKYICSDTSRRKKRRRNTQDAESVECLCVSSPQAVPGPHRRGELHRHLQRRHQTVDGRAGQHRPLLGPPGGTAAPATRLHLAGKNTHVHSQVYSSKQTQPAAGTDCFFCPTNSPKSINDQKKQQMLMCKKLEPTNV